MCVLGGGVWHVCVGGGGLLFVLKGVGGYPPPQTPTPPPSEPLLPVPPSAEKQVSGDILEWRPLRRVAFVTNIYIISVTDTVFQRPLTAFFNSLVDLPPRAEAYKAHRAYSPAQKATSTLFLGAPIATLHRFVTVAKGDGTTGPHMMSWIGPDGCGLR